jgi:chromosome segregation ATPase
VKLEKEDFEIAVSSAEKQSSYFRLEQVGLRSALEELKKMRESHEINEGLYGELYERYSQRLSDINEKAEQYRRITQSIRHLSKYEKELELLMSSQKELVQRLEKTESRLEEERGKVLDMAEKFGIIVVPREARPVREDVKPVQEELRPATITARTPPVTTPSPTEISEAESEIERLRKEIMAELERVKTQTKK